jgi:cation-transporting ATPase E
MEAGIENADKFVDASTLTTERKLKSAIREYTVFGRVTPDQKRKLIRAFKAAGHTVAMTGDGVNDVLALKDADCSIAMASGSDVACHVSQLVLMDSNFAAMPSVVNEGRRVINNIERSASLFLVKNIFSFTLTLTALIFALGYPITPSQLSLFT